MTIHIAQTTHVARCPSATCICMCAHTHDTVVYSKFRKHQIHVGVLEPQVVEIWPFPLLWLLAFRTACMAVVLPYKLWLSNIVVFWHSLIRVVITQILVWLFTQKSSQVWYFLFLWDFLGNVSKWLNKSNWFFDLGYPWLGLHYIGKAVGSPTLQMVLPYPI